MILYAALGSWGYSQMLQNGNLSTVVVYVAEMTELIIPECNCQQDMFMMNSTHYPLWTTQVQPQGLTSSKNVPEALPDNLEKTPSTPSYTALNTRPSSPWFAWPHVGHIDVRSKPTHMQAQTKLKLFSSGTSCHNVSNMLRLSPSQADPEEARGSRHVSASRATCLDSGTVCLQGEKITVQVQNMHY